MQKGSYEEVESHLFVFLLIWREALEMGLGCGEAQEPTKRVGFFAAEPNRQLQKWWRMLITGSVTIRKDSLCFGPPA